MSLTEKQKEQVLNRLELLLPEVDDTSLLELLIEDAADQMLAFTHRSKLPDGLIKSVGDLVVIAYNRLGTEGESGRSEGGESYSFIEMPESVYNIAKGYRLARIGGNAYESENEAIES